MTKPIFFQLPESAFPTQYNLVITPDLQKATFHVKESINITVLTPTKTLTLNAIELEIQSASIETTENPSLSATNITYNSTQEIVSFEFDQTIPTGSAILHIECTGILNDRLHGFYRSSYLNEQSQETFMAATQFEPTDARRAFPCWDEPSIKATFGVTLIIASDLTAVSNTLVEQEKKITSALKSLTFKPTPKMSTYLLAFIVGDLESIETKTKDGTLIRIFATRGKIAQGQFALDVSKKLLDYFNEYFQIPYPLEKLDHLAIPDFAAGAMENWGAITYREVALLFDKDKSSPATKQRITEIVAHEMAHMWFGDLVTMEWWNDLWLNESFASWMAIKAMDHLYPEWEMWTQFIVMDVNAGMGLDGLENSHPIEQEVKDPTEINQLFDAISYSKGASIIRMLEQFIGAEIFQKGLYDYLSNHTYSNAKGVDLWTAMEQASGKPIVSMMNSWIKQSGYPVVDLSISCTDKQQAILLKQHRFLFSGSQNDQTLWEIPITVLTNTNENQSTIMSTRSASFVIPNSDDKNPTAWVKLNRNHTGFYRTAYTPDDLLRFKEKIYSKELPAVDRLGIVTDAYALSRARMLPIKYFLELTQSFQNESDYGVWADILGSLRSIQSLISDKPYIEDYKTLCRNLVSNIVENLGWDPVAAESHLQSMLRSTVLDASGAFGNKSVLNEASERFNSAVNNPDSLAPEIKGCVYTLAARNGSSTTYNTMHAMAQKQVFQEERLRLYYSLTRFPQIESIQQTLNLSLSDEVRSQDTVSLIAQTSGNPQKGLGLTWQFMKENWQELDRRYGQGGFAMMNLVSIAGRFTTKEDRNDVESFFQKNPVPSATRTIQQVLERIDLNIAWIKYNDKALEDWLRSQ